MDIIKELQNKDEKEAYAFFRKIYAESAESDRYYPLYDDFLMLVNSPNSFVRTRGFLLCCGLSRWDRENRIDASLKQLLTVLNDEKPITVRKAIEGLHEVVLFKPELNETIKEYLLRIDVSQYKDSMAPLIEKDISELLKRID